MLLQSALCKKLLLKLINLMDLLKEVINLKDLMDLMDLMDLKDLDLALNNALLTSAKMNHLTVLLNANVMVLMLKI